MSWFSLNKLRDSLYAILEFQHWVKVCSYLLVGKTGAFLVDSGTGICDIKPVVRSLTDLPVTVITTHCHWDHIGNHGSFDDIRVHKDEADWMKTGIPVPISVLREQVMMEPFDMTLCPDFDIDAWSLPLVENPGILQDGDILDNGMHKLRVIWTPGHSPGSICLWDENERLLLTGDTLYRGVIYANYPSTSPADLCDSLEKLALLKPEMILPGHNDDHLDSHILQTASDLVTRLRHQGMVQQGTGLHGDGDVQLQF